MELSGNVWEQCVGGRGSVNLSAFNSANGNGMLNTVGFCDILTWPATGGSNNGTILRGGGWNSAAGQLIVGDRVGRNTTNNLRELSTGGRGVRSY
jgi:hypothetical protein